MPLITAKKKGTVFFSISNVAVTTEDTERKLIRKPHHFKLQTFKIKYFRFTSGIFQKAKHSTVYKDHKMFYLICGFVNTL